MPRISRGCFRCRQRRVKCDGGRPACQRCVTRNETCVGYKDESDIIFRHETEKVVRIFRALPVSPPRSAPSETSELRSGRRRSCSASEAIPSGGESSRLGDYGHFPLPLDHFALEFDSPSSSWPTASTTSNETEAGKDERAVQTFFDKYVVYPCSPGSSVGFLEHLPCLFKEVNIDGRCALRWAVLAAAFGDASTAGFEPGLRQRALECYGNALAALGRSLAEKGKSPDDYDLMTVVILDLFETLFLPNVAPRGHHAHGMAHILRLRVTEQFHDPRGWSLFQLAHHRIQKQQLAFHLPPSRESEHLLNHLDEQLAFAHLERDALQISSICTRGRAMMERLASDKDLSITDVIQLVREMHSLDQTVVKWRTGPEWSFRTVKRLDLTGHPGILATFPELVQLHPDVWNAYEWNYHRTARIIMHEQLLTCLRRMSSASSPDDNVVTEMALLTPLEVESITIIQGLADKILATVPQTFGDIDHDGRVRDNTGRPPRCRAVGAYLLLWPIKIIKSQQSSVTSAQKQSAQGVFERIREYTGMKSYLGNLSII